MLGFRVLINVTNMASKVRNWPRNENQLVHSRDVYDFYVPSPLIRDLPAISEASFCASEEENPLGLAILFGCQQYIRTRTKIVNHRNRPKWHSKTETETNKTENIFEFSKEDNFSF